MYGEMETTKEIQESTISPPPSDNRQLANRVVFVVPGEEKALMIYDQSPEEPEAKFAGYLPEGKFHALGMEVVDFDQSQIDKEYSVIRYKDGSCIQRVIVVEEKTFLSLALQGMYPQYSEEAHRRHYMVIDMHDESRDIKRETIQAIFDEDQGELNSNQKAILDAAIDVSGEEMRNIVINGNDKNQK